LPKISVFNMPNMARRNKGGGSRFPITHGPKPFRKPDSVKDLLARVTPTLTRVSEQATRQIHWRGWLDERLPADLAMHLTGVVEREDTLVVFAESAAWCARLRFALQEIEAQIRESRPAIQQVTVRVLPKTGATTLSPTVKPGPRYRK
jgi:hypothetical protein